MVAMSFFDEPSLQTPESEEPEPQRTPWRGTSDDTTGVVVPLVRVLARTEDVAIIVSGFVAYPSGFDFSVITISRLAWDVGIPEPPSRPYPTHSASTRSTTSSSMHDPNS
jgi:hypothetical protein